MAPAALLVLAYVLMLIGVVGAFLPAIPGSVLVLAGALLYALGTGMEPIDGWRLGVLAALAAAAYVLDYLSAALGTKTLGGSRWAMLGAIAGGILGLFFGPLGILVGPIAGAVLVELLYRKDVSVALKSGIGAVAGVLLGVVAKLSLSIAMISLFTYWVVRG